MKSRLAILGMLVAGMLFSTTGAGLAISGLTSSNSASIAQYGGNEGDNGSSPQGGVEGAGTGSGSPSGGTGSGLQPTQQVEAGATGSSGQLPFTGYAAIPVLLGGIALLSTGLIIRRRAREDA